MLAGFWQKFKPENGEPKAEASKELAEGKIYSSEELVRPFLIIFLLVVVVVLSCLTVVTSAFEYRQLFHQYQGLVQQRDELQVEWGQLLLEQSAWAANNRVEQQAIKKLGMQVPEVNQIEIVRHE
ncbi:cell division protein FtsL [uncultured Neptuniibacter sp.]|uniref:cell division protein FtsL n=1 Tax=uncultured Neptuniibacter sp. TaxID=502143 RepID=UPI00260876D6|nr:cell division protein FtsL [uncultured Neptuniibacter sp.]